MPPIRASYLVLLRTLDEFAWGIGEVRGFAVTFFPSPGDVQCN